MNRTTYLTLAAGLAAIAAAGCGSGGGATNAYVPKKPATSTASAIVPIGQEATYFPFAAGNQWTFESTTVNAINGQQGPPKISEVTYKLDKVVDSPTGGKDAYFSVTTDGVVTDMEVWRAEANGLSQVSMGKKKLNPLNPPQPVLPFPVKDKGTFSWTGTITPDNGELRTSSIQGTILGQQPIDTNMGQYNALAVESKGTLKTTNTDAQMASTIWLVPGVGIGRYRMEVQGTALNPKDKSKKVHFGVIQTMKLKNVSLKK